ncbi:MAG: NTF2 fold immunity protein [Desulfobacteraceae bacterium]|nr:NTF2 fold immunity protein [Desulfobacteraceae bacterium]
MKLKFLIILAGLLLINLINAQENKHNYIPDNGYVPTSEVAIKIAVAVWEPIYGNEKIQKQYPYKAILLNEIWYVEGSLPPKKEYIDPTTGEEMVRVTAGGVAEAEISKKTGQILRISHGK